MPLNKCVHCGSSDVQPEIRHWLCLNCGRRTLMVPPTEEEQQENE